MYSYLFQPYHKVRVGNLLQMVDFRGTEVQQAVNYFISRTLIHTCLQRIEFRFYPSGTKVSSGQN